MAAVWYTPGQRSVANTCHGRKSMAHELIEYFAARQNETVTLLRQLVELESPSESKPALDRLGAFIATQLRDVGASVEVVPQTTAGDHLVATFGGANAVPSAPAVPSGP